MVYGTYNNSAGLAKKKVFVTHFKNWDEEDEEIKEGNP